MAYRFDGGSEPQLYSDVNEDREKPDETPGLRGERIVGEFLRSAFPGVIIKLERTGQYDANDTNGIDFIVELAGENGETCQIALDVTFDGDARLRAKMNRTAMNPCTYAHDDNGKAVGREMPRILFKDKSIGFWAMQEEDAKKRGLELINVMPASEKSKKQKEFLEKVLDQINGLSAAFARYKELIKPAVKILRQEADKVVADYPGKITKAPARKPKAR